MTIINFLALDEAHGEVVLDDELRQASAPTLE